MTQEELQDAELMGLMSAVLSLDAFAREHYEAIRKIPASNLGIRLPMEKRFPPIKEIEGGLVMDKLADHALLYYTAGLSDEVRCVGRWITSGLAMEETKGFGK